jgi:DnaJ-class molecular chaperone
MNDIKKRYKNLSKKLHTDKGGDEEEMKKLNWAYKVLKEYIDNFRFSFSDEEILKQYPQEFIKKFKV